MKPCRSPAQHLQEAGLGTGIPPTARFTYPKSADSPRPGAPARTRRRRQQNCARGQPASGRKPPRARPQRERGAPGVAAGGGTGRGGGLTRRGGPRDARDASSACAAPPLRATASQRSGSGRSGRSSGSSAPGVASAPPRAPAAAGSASILAASPSLGGAVAGPAAYRRPAARGPGFSCVRPRVARSLFHCDLQSTVFLRK